MYENESADYRLVKKSGAVKQVIAALLGVGLLVISVIGATFAFFTYSKVGTKDNVISTGAISFSYDEGASGLTLTNSFPVTDVVGSAGTAYQFTVSGSRTGAASIGYTISAVVGDAISGKTRFSDSLVKLYLTGSGSNGTLASFPAAAISSLPLTLGSGTITSASSTTHTYQVRMWISDAVAISDTDVSISGKTVITTSTFASLYYSIKINVTATST